MTTEGLSPQEDEQLAALLAKCRVGGISTPVFTGIARFNPLPIVEVVLFQSTQGVLETLLVPRPGDDIVWKNQLHTPGGAIWAKDFERQDGNPVNGVFERVQREIKNDFAYPPTYAGRLYQTVERGPEVADIYFSQVVSSIEPNQEWCPVRDLPSHPRFMQIQGPRVLMAAREFWNQFGPRPL